MKGRVRCGLSFFIDLWVILYDKLQKYGFALCKIFLKNMLTKKNGYGNILSVADEIKEKAAKKIKKIKKGIDKPKSL